MKVCPQRHDRQHEPGRTAFVVAGSEERAAPGDQCGKSKDMRAGQQMRQHQHPSGKGGDDRGKRRQAAE